MPKKIYIRTFGCQMNVADSLRMAELLKSAGYSEAASEKSADAVILNTCSVRGLAEQKVWSKIGQLNKLKTKRAKQGKKLFIGIAGCMAQLHKKNIFRRAPEVNIVCGTYRLHKMPELLERAFMGQKAIDVDCVEHDLNGSWMLKNAASVCAFVPISRGCNNFCSYCVVPHVRGEERNRSAEEIEKEIKSLVDVGVKEVTLLGQNVNSYKSGNYNFVKLLERINEIDGLLRVRFMTSHPKDASVSLFKAMAGLSKVCEFMHLPIQCGSNKILQKMNRKYTREHYFELIKKLREIVSNVSVSTDIITGFPGETEEDFKDTYDAMKMIQYDSAFIFKYSPRPGTKAAEEEDDVPTDVKKERHACLLKLQENISAAKNEKLMGTCQEVLVEGKSDADKTKLSGRTRTNKIVFFEGVDDLIGKLVGIKIISANAHALYGEWKS